MYPVVELVVGYMLVYAVVELVICCSRAGYIAGYMLKYCSRAGELIYVVVELVI